MTNQLHLFQPLTAPEPVAEVTSDELTETAEIPNFEGDLTVWHEIHYNSGVTFEVEKDSLVIRHISALGTYNLEVCRLTREQV